MNGTNSVISDEKLLAENEIYQLKNIDISLCDGCFSCWSKSISQGSCHNIDITNEIKMHFITSDYVIILSHIIFGGYSYHIKKVMDRMIPLIPPLFEIVDSKLLNKKLFNKYPGIMAIGVIKDTTEEEQFVFQSLVERNAKTFHSPWWKVLFYNEKQFKNELDHIISDIVLGLEG